LISRAHRASAAALAVSRSKLYQLIASGAVASIRIDGSRRVPVSALQDYITHLISAERAA